MNQIQGMADQDLGHHNMFNQNPHKHSLHKHRSYSHLQYARNQYKDPYIGEHYAFPQPQQAQVFYQEAAYPAYMGNPQQPLDDFYTNYGGHEYADFVYPEMMQDEFAEMEEISTRPRLTKEQVEVLESQFQANHKPNSQLKRQLAIQTKLTLPRVAVRLSFLVSRLHANIGLELVPKPSRESEAAEETGGIRGPESFHQGRSE
jgi:hypothetical protein